MALIRVPTINPDGVNLYRTLSSTCLELGLNNRLAILMCDARERERVMRARAH
jgi:hypothetical protein